MIQPPELDIDLQLGVPTTPTARMYRRVIANLLDHIQKAGFTMTHVYVPIQNAKSPAVIDALKALMKAGASAQQIEKRYQDKKSLTSLSVICAAYHIERNPELLNDTKKEGKQ